MDNPYSGSGSSSFAVALPKHSELSSENLSFLDQHFRTPEDLLHKAPHLLASLCKQCSDLETHVLHLQTTLAKRTVSWISRSFAAKNALNNLSLNLQNLSLLTSKRLYSVNFVSGFRK